VSRQDPFENEKLVRPLRARFLREKDLGHAAGSEATHEFELSDLLLAGRIQTFSHGSAFGNVAV